MVVCTCGNGSWICLVIVCQLNTGVRVLGFLITMSRKEARWWQWWTWTRTYSPQQQALVLFSVTIHVIQCRCWCCDQWLSLLSQGEGGRVFIKELHNSHVGHACNDCNGSTICMYYEQKTSAWQKCSEDTYSTCHERKPRLHNGTVMVDTDKYRLIGIPSSSRTPQDVRLTRIW